MSHETIYTTIYAMLRGELRKELVACLRQGKTTRRRRAGGTDRRRRLPDLLSIHLRPPEVEDRCLPGHWEGDPMIGARNRSAVGTPVERVSWLVLLVQLDSARADAVLKGFAAAIERVPPALRRTLTYD